MAGYYLEDSIRLQGQPKRTIADYVEQQGILVPRRFSSLEEARSTGVPVIARSEHPQEYRGVSGLLSSQSFSQIPKELTEAGIKRQVCEERRTYINAYCEAFHKQPAEVEGEISFSFWQELGGYNRTIIADSAVQGRYHITTFFKDKEGFSRRTYNIVDLQGNVQHYGGSLPSDADNLLELVKMYEQVRNLDRFNPNHCPILEVQTVNGTNYFLQYHRTRDFSPAIFSLDRAPEADEAVAVFTRGATSPEGVVGNIKSGGLSASEYFNLHSRPIGFVTALSSLDETLQEAVHSHLSTSYLFKPQVSVIAAKPQLANQASEEEVMSLRVISDGRKAYVKRV